MLGSRSPLPLALSASIVLTASLAAATTTEPNGLVVPLDSANGEVQLYSLFQSLADPVDWKADAAATPNAFSPLCGFTATFVLNEAGYHLGLAWYNEKGQKPQAADLHTIFPPNTPVGSMFTGTAIKNDPAYAGGLVGFALVGSETHYTNAAYNNTCTACSPPGPWITAVMYPSKKTPNAYYIAFEDGATSASGWANDGDFNDDVFFLTGLTCSGGGQPCDTGKPGICGPGITQCTANGVVCQQLSMPKATETCNGLDDNCDGSTDEGDICPSGEICDKGTCVQSCAGGEFGCPPNKACNAEGYCVDPACKDVSCPSGQVCVGGVCKGPCDGVVCPGGQVCRVGACVDPCAGVTCDSSQVCDGGVCVARCDCLPCSAGKACDAPSGLCVDPACVGVTCNPGSVCAGGGCVDACTGAVCPAGQVCLNGACIEAQGTGGSTGVGFGVGGGGSGPGGTGGASIGSGGSSASGTGGSGGSGSNSSCGCRAAGDEGGERSLAIVGVGLAIAFAARRRAAGRS